MTKQRVVLIRSVPPPLVSQAHVNRVIMHRLDNIVTCSHVLVIVNVYLLVVYKEYVQHVIILSVESTVMLKHVLLIINVCQIPVLVVLA